MKHLFIINPAAGKYDHTGEFTQKIRAVCGREGLDYEVLVSRAPGDCTRPPRQAARNCASTPAAATARSMKSSTARQGMPMSP